MKIGAASKATRSRASPVTQCFFFFFINLLPLKKLSTTNYTPFALDSEPESLTDILHIKTIRLSSFGGHTFHIVKACL